MKAFETMVRKDFTFDPKKKTAETYINGRGEKAYKGSKCLKGTQPPGWKIQATFFMLDMVIWLVLLIVLDDILSSGGFEKKL